MARHTNVASEACPARVYHAFGNKLCLRASRVFTARVEGSPSPPEAEAEADLEEDEPK